MEELEENAFMHLNMSTMPNYNEPKEQKCNFFHPKLNVHLSTLGCFLKQTYIWLKLPILTSAKRKLRVSKHHHTWDP